MEGSELPEVSMSKLKQDRIKLPTEAEWSVLENVRLVIDRAWQLLEQKSRLEAKGRYQQTKNG